MYVTSIPVPLYLYITKFICMIISNLLLLVNEFIGRILANLFFFLILPLLFLCWSLIVLFPEYMISFSYSRIENLLDYFIF